MNSDKDFLLTKSTSSVITAKKILELCLVFGCCDGSFSKKELKKIEEIAFEFSKKLPFGNLDLEKILEELANEFVRTNNSDRLKMLDVNGEYFYKAFPPEDRVKLLGLLDSLLKTDGFKTKSAFFVYSMLEKKLFPPVEINNHEGYFYSCLFTVLASLQFLISGYNLTINPVFAYAMSGFVIFAFVVDKFVLRRCPKCQTKNICFLKEASLNDKRFYVCNLCKAEWCEQKTNKQL